MITYQVISKKNVITQKLMYYPCIKQQGAAVPTKLLMKDIERMCTLTEADVHSFAEALRKVLSDALVDGHSVHLGTLGLFWPTMAAVKGQVSADNVDDEVVKKLRCRFRPAPSLKARIARKDLNFTKYEEQ